MADQEFIKTFEERYTKLLQSYKGGLSHTSIRKFDEIRQLFAEKLSIDIEDVYAIGAGTRPGNIEVRLSQGTRAFQLTKLGLAFIKVDDKSKIASQSDSAVTTIKGFLERGKASYESILVVVENNSKITITRLVTYPSSTILAGLRTICVGLSDFNEIVMSTPMQTEQHHGTSTQLAMHTLEHAKWNIPTSSESVGFNFSLQRLIEGSPGSGKSFTLDKDSNLADKVVRTVFHPESGFSDFVGFLSPETAYRVEDPAPVFTKSLPGEPVVYYEFSYGPLLEAYILAVMNPEHKIVLIIEELSRAPASLVFGETLQLLDRVRDGEDAAAGVPAGYSRYEIRPKADVQAYLKALDVLPPFTQDGCMRFPSNLYIWATMNRADQNARQLDTAFLRRWNREHISHDSSGVYDERLVSVGGSDMSWGKFRAGLNKLLLDAGSREDKLIGPYFLPEDKVTDPMAIVDDLFAYVWHDVLREDGGVVFPGVRTFAELRERWFAGTLKIDI